MEQTKKESVTCTIIRIIFMDFAYFYWKVNQSIAEVVWVYIKLMNY